jgi:hypothetical protein
LPARIRRPEAAIAWRSVALPRVFVCVRVFDNEELGGNFIEEAYGQFVTSLGLTGENNLDQMSMNGRNILEHGTEYWGQADQTTVLVASAAKLRALGEVVVLDNQEEQARRDALVVQASIDALDKDVEAKTEHKKELVKKK